MPDTSRKYEKSNFIYNIIEGALYIAGGSLISSQTVLPALVNRLGGGNIEVGALGVIVYLALFLPQILSSRYAQTIAWKKKWVLRFGVLQRVVIILIGLVVLLIGKQHPHLSLWLFLLLFTINQLVLSVNTPLWFDFITKLTPLQIRGKLIGIRNSIAGFLSLLASFLLTWLLVSFSFPLNYALVFFVTFAIQISAIFFQARIVEDRPSAIHPLPTLKEYISHLQSILRENKAFVSFLLSSVFLILATMPMNFFAVYAINHFNADEHLIGRFTMIGVGGQIIGALLNGYLADKFGNKLALLSASVAVLLSSICAWVAPSVSMFSIVFFGVGIFIGSEMMIRYNLSVEYGHSDHRATYIALMNTILAPCYFSGLLGGVLCNMFGYDLVFLVGIVCSVIGISLLITRVTEPRFRKF